MTSRLCDIRLEGDDTRALSAELDQERKVAIFDLLEDNSFALLDGPQGPYRLTLGTSGSRLAFDLHTDSGTPAAAFALSLGPLRQIVKDYAAICASYYAAVRDSAPSEIEALDEARRAIHGEGAETLRTLLDGKAAIDEATGKRLFTLVCTLAPVD